MIYHKPILLIAFLGLVCISKAQNIDSVLQTLSEQSLIDQIRKLDDLAWDNMYVNYEYAKNYALIANKMALENDYQNLAGNTFNTLGVICRRQGLFEESKHYYHKSGEIWRATENKKQIMNYNQNMANLLRAEGKNDSALFYGNVGLELALEELDSFKISALYLGIGTTYKNMGWYGTAIDYYTIGAEIDQALGDTIGMGIYWSNIGDVLYNIKDYQGALDYYEETLKIDQYDNNKLNQSITRKTIGMTYHQLGQYDSAMLSYDLGLQLASEIGDDVMVGDILASKAELLTAMNNPIEAIELYNQALTISKEYDNTLLEVAALYGMGNTHLRMRDYKMSQEYLLKANEKALAIDHGTVILGSYQTLAEVYGTLGKTNEAFSHLSKYVEINDSLNNATMLAKIAELENKYELNNKNHQIELQASIIDQNELQLQRNRAIGGSVILLLIGIIGLVIWIFKRKQYKTKIEHELERARLKEEQIKAVILSQEKERKRFAMDLHDDLGQLISAMKLNVSRFTEETDSKHITKESNELLDNMYVSLKNIAFDLMPHTLFEKGLEEAIDELRSQVNASGKIKMDFQSFEIQDRIDADQKVAIYRIIQELISNTLKYSNASKINISITDFEDQLSLMIEDDGDGFDLDSFRHGKGNGWRNIHSRLDLLNGAIDFDTLVGRKNNTVSIEIPYALKETIAA